MPRADCEDDAMALKAMVEHSAYISGMDRADDRPGHRRARGPRYAGAVLFRPRAGLGGSYSICDSIACHSAGFTRAIFIGRNEPSTNTWVVAPRARSAPSAARTTS